MPDELYFYGSQRSRLQVLCAAELQRLGFDHVRMPLPSPAPGISGGTIPDWGMLADKDGHTMLVVGDDQEWQALRTSPDEFERLRTWIEDVLAECPQAEAVAFFSLAGSPKVIMAVQRHLISQAQANLSTSERARRVHLAFLNGREAVKRAREEEALRAGGRGAGAGETEGAGLLGWLGGIFGSRSSSLSAALGDDAADMLERSAAGNGLPDYRDRDGDGLYDRYEVDSPFDHHHDLHHTDGEGLLDLLFDHDDGHDLL